MKFDCGPSNDELLEARLHRLSEWHRWFAWRPVRVDSHDCRWLEVVRRRGSYMEWNDTWLWEYQSQDETD